MAHTDSLGRPMPVDASGLLIPEAAAKQETEARRKLSVTKLILPGDVAAEFGGWAEAHDKAMALLGFTVEDRHTLVYGDGVGLSSMSHPDGSLLASELAAEAEEMMAEETSDLLAAITRDIARGG